LANEQAEAVSLKVAAGTGRSNRLGAAKIKKGLMRFAQVLI